MDILEQVDGKLTILGILGDPISQVKAPLMMNAELRRLQIADTLMVSFHISSKGLKPLVIGLKSLRWSVTSSYSRKEQNCFRMQSEKAIPPITAARCCNIRSA